MPYCPPLLYYLAVLDAFRSSAPLCDGRREAAPSHFRSILVIRLQIRSISALSSALCLPPFVAIRSAALAAGKLCHRRSAAKIVSRSALVSLIIIWSKPCLTLIFFIRLAKRCHAIVTFGSRGKPAKEIL
jgi:hypothetical protein